MDYLKELKRIVSNIRARHPEALNIEDWELFRQTIRILEICGKDSFSSDQRNSSSLVFKVN